MDNLTYRAKMERYKRAEELFSYVKELIAEQFPKLIDQMSERTIIFKAKSKGLLTDSDYNLLMERYR